MRQNQDPKDFRALLGKFAKELRDARLAARSHIASYAGDPADASDGDVWVNTTTGALRIRLAGVNRTITTT